MTARLDDAASIPANPVSDGDPLRVFRHDRLPGWALVHRSRDATAFDDVGAAVEDAMRSVTGEIGPGARVAIAAGSRGIDRIDEVVAAMVRAIRAAGANVFVIPAMGSHGGATADGQLEVLASRGMTPDRLGCEIRASMDTVRLGE